jgi:hypothetical protein
MRLGLPLVLLTSSALGQEAEPAPSPGVAQGETQSGQASDAAASDPGATAQTAPKADSATVGLGADTRASAMQAYQSALQAQRLGAATGPLSTARLREELQRVEAMLLEGRRDEAIGDLVYWVASPGFKALAELPEGRGARCLLGDAMARAGVVEIARGYLQPLLASTTNDIWFRRAVRSTVDLALDSSHGATLLEDLQSARERAPAELQSDIAYLEGRTAEAAGKSDRALAAYAAVTPRGRFWAQAQYRAGLLFVDDGQLKSGEQKFCRVADPKQTPKEAALFGGSDFFRVRDLARLGLGRVAHEQFRFGDARYYYYLVPQDSEHLPEALYESATSRYEAKDYAAARDLLNELRARGEGHPYSDEAWVLEAYVDMALCDFPQADAKLKAFLKQYEPLRGALRRVYKDDDALGRLLEAMRLNQDPATAGLGIADNQARALAVLLRVDASYTAGAQQLATLEHQMQGLQQALGEMDDLSARLAGSDTLQPRADGAEAVGATRKVELIQEQIAELKRLLREVSRRGNAAQLTALQSELQQLQGRAREASRNVGLDHEDAAGAASAGVPLLLQEDRTKASELFVAAQGSKQGLINRQQALAKDAFERLDRRLTRLLRRARLARVETVLGRKRALEIEIEGLAQGVLPQGAVDSLDAARYLQDGEEYWPFDGEDWADEYVGGEGLR